MHTQHHIVNTRRQQGGFTLIEIAIVLAIIGLLIAALTAARGLQQSAEDDQAIAWMEGVANSAGEFQRRFRGNALGDVTDIGDIAGSVNFPDSNTGDRTRFGIRDTVIEASLDSGDLFGDERWYVQFDNVPGDLAAELDSRLSGALADEAGLVRGHDYDSAADIDSDDDDVSIQVAVNPPAYNEEDTGGNGDNGG